MDVDARSANGLTPLHWAAANGTPETIEALLEAGADPTVRDDDGDTPGDLAAEREDRELRSHSVFRRLNEARFE